MQNEHIKFEVDIPIGKWGRLHQDYLKESRPDFYRNLLEQGDLQQYLLEIDERAELRMEMISDELQKVIQSEKKTDTEKSGMQWLLEMRDIIELAEEVVLNEIVYE